MSMALLFLCVCYNVMHGPATEWAAWAARWSTCRQVFETARRDPAAGREALREVTGGSAITPGPPVTEA
jgi:hypothetical protein